MFEITQEMAFNFCYEPDQVDQYMGMAVVRVISRHLPGHILVLMSFGNLKMSLGLMTVIHLHPMS